MVGFLQQPFPGCSNLLRSAMATGSLEPIFHYSIRDRLKFCRPSPISAIAKIKIESFSFKGSLKFHSRRGCFHETEYPLIRGIGASHTETATVGNSEDSDIFFQQSFPLKRTERVEGKISIRLDRPKHGQDLLLTVGCDLPGKWVIHWGVFYEGVHGREWNQAPPKMRPSGSVAIKDYAIETPLKRSSTVTEGDFLSEVKISYDPRSSVESINFVLKDEESGAYYQHRGRDFMVPLTAYLHEEDNIVGAKKSLGILRDVSESKDKEASDEFKNSAQTKKRLEGFYEEHTVVKEISVDRSVSISVRKSPEMANNLLYLETDIPGDVFVHWGVCRDKNKKWVIPASPYPPKTTKFDRALETLLQPKGNGRGSWVSFTLDEEFVGFAFVLKAMGDTWIKHMGNDFYIPLSNSTILNTRSKLFQNKSQANVRTSEVVSGSSEKSGVGLNQDVGQTTFTDGIISEIKNLVKDISSEKMRKTKSKEAHEGILQEIEKLAAEAYSIFRTSTPMLSEGSVVEIEPLEPPVKISSGTGSGFEILCQGFNWESHKSGRWYMELNEKAEQLSSLGFSVIWLPPPTESVSPEGYMPKDLYNLNSRYGSADELKVLVERFHENGLKVLGDVVLNHRCAHHQNQNGVWNVFGGRLPWDDRAVVADDPHFQGRGNKSSGDNFHAAPNIDHSQDFVRKDIKEWLCWLREEIGFDGWRLDFVRGFWGGYVKDYLNATEPYFAVGEYWDSLNYTYGVMDHNQDAHRQRIVDWITATNGTAGAFDVTTKGILHSALEKCEYWRLSDQKGKPPGVVGWWPSRAITFIENHDTGSTQGHWRFPGGKEMQGYTYILTHPGTPSVFYDHLFSHYHSQIAALLSVRRRNKIHCRSEVKIVKAGRDVYAAIVDDKVCMKIGPGFYEPQSERGRWSVAVEGSDYKVWEAL